MQMTFSVNVLVSAIALGLGVLGGCGTDDLYGMPDCDPGYERDANLECQLVCDTMAHFVAVGDECVCQSGYELVGEVCLPLCASGWERQPDNSCLFVCPEGYEAVDETCLFICVPPMVPNDTNDGCIAPPDPGSIEGRVCDYARGIWLEGIAVSLDLPDGSTVTTHTNQEGRFTIEDIPVGVYYVNFAGTDYSNVIPAQVLEGQVTTLGPDECIPPPGHLRGAVCDERWGVWIDGATVTLNDTNGTSTTTDAFGAYMFFSIPPGDYVLTITHPDGFSGSRTGTVLTGEVTELGPLQCMGAAGSVTGRICGTDGFWLTNASVSTYDEDGSLIETTTDGNGYYTLDGLQPGTYTIRVVKGSYEMEFDVEVLPDQPTTIPLPICIPPTTRMAVVTGIYDSVQTVLTDLGYSIRANYDGTTTPSIVDANGTIDVVTGTSTFWLNDFLTDPVWMADYDIIFFNCGVSDSGLMTMTTTSAALENLRSFAEDGGSVYASDWASEVIRLAFPGRILFDGDDTSFGAARVGVSDNNLTAYVIDQGLVSSLGDNEVVINLNLGAWVVMDRVNLQPSDVRVLLMATIQKQAGWLDPPTTISEVPLTLRFDFGAGRVLYTSAHNEANNTPDLEHVLNYIVFEL